MRENAFKPIEKLFVKYLEQEAEKINTEFDFAKSKVSIYFPSNEEPAGVSSFSMGISCDLLRVSLDKTDYLALEIAVYDKYDKLAINADVCWGNPYSKVEKEVFEEPVEVNEENLAMIQEKLPGLVAKLRELIRDNPNGI